MEDYILFILIGIVIAVIYVVKKISNDIIDEKKNVLKIKKELDIQRQAQLQKDREINSRINYINRKDAEIKEIIKEKTQSFPYLASVLSEWEFLHDTLIADMLENKKRPAKKAADEIRQISRDKRVLAKKCRAYENQIKMYEALFPWLEEFKELPPEEAYQYISLQDEHDEYTRVKDWLSPEEYSNLSDPQKWQLALEIH